MHSLGKWSGRAGVAALAMGGLMAVAGAQGRGGRGGPQATIVVPALQFRYMGPASAGRIAAVAGVDGDPNTYYLGSASGGLWKSSDGGATFIPIMDATDVAAIGTITIAPSDPSTVWVGTGEPWVIRPSDVIGDGVYRTSDAGKTWRNVGLENTGRIARIVVAPSDPNTAYVCAEGRLTGPQQERGVYKTSDGGTHWTQVLFVNADTGCSGLSMDAAHPETLIAGTWQVAEHTWGEFSGGPGSGVYMTHDGGAHWSQITGAGLPQSPLGKIDVAFAPSNPQRVYALIQTAAQGSLWRSDDGGATWKVVSWDRSLIGRAGYYIRLAVNPQNPDDVLIASSSFHRSSNGGLTFSGGGGGGSRAAGQASCGDCHDIWMDAKIPGRYALTDDGGASIATGKGTVVHASLPNGQMYHIATDNRVPYWIYSNRQDDGTMRGPSTVSESSGNGYLPDGSFMPSGGRGGFGARGGANASGGGRALAPAPPEPPAGYSNNAPPGGIAGGRGGAAALAWQADIGGCESGFTLPDPTDANIVWATCYGNKLTRWDAREGEAHSVEPWEISLDSPPNQAKYRCHWTAPLAIDPFDHNTVYYGCQMILKTSNGGQSWTQFSPDLSTKDPSRIVSNGGLVGDNLGQYDGEVVWSIAPSPIQKGLIWAGTNDGKIWNTRDGGAHWNDLTRNIALPPWGEFNQISPSSFDAGTAYAAIDYRLGSDDYKPYIYKTADYGATWTKINGDIPSANPLDYVLAVAENPNRKGMLFAGTGHAFYYSMDDGSRWVKFDQGLPPAPVSWITVEKRFHDVDISTYGRGLYILPDITALEQTGEPVVGGGTTELLKPGPVFRLARSVFPTAAEPTRPQFQFHLASAPAGPITMEILDAAGKTIRTEELTGHAGLNGADWDLHLDGPTLVALRTTPPENPHIWDELRFQGRDTRTITHWGITPTTGVPVAAPGAYQVRLTIDGKAYSQPFEVVKDPAVMASDADLQASTAMQVRVRNDITATSEMVNTMEIWRKKIEDQRKAKATDTAATAALDNLNTAILEVEHQLVTESEMLSDDKYFPEAYKVYMNLIWTSGAVGQGASDEAGGLDYRPTDTQVEVVTMLERQLAEAKVGFDKLRSTTVPAFNRAMAGKVAAISAP